MLCFDFEKKEVLKTVDQAKVWSTILGFMPKPKQKFCSPFRPDTHPSCELVQYNNLLMVDWAKHQYYDCLQGLSLKNPHLSYIEVVNLAYNCTGSSVSWNYEKKPANIKGIFREWNTLDKDYWTRRFVNKAQLLKWNINPCRGITINENTTYFSSLCYSYPVEYRSKFYFPNEQPLGAKFLGNLRKDDLWFIDNQSDILLISKAHKDLLVLENLIDINITHVQSESTLPSKPVLDQWILKHKKIFILFDNDETGIFYANKLCSTLESSIDVRIILAPSHKDIDEMIVNQGLKETKECLRELLCA